MKNVLILGSGMVVKPIAHYLLENTLKVTIASRTKIKAEKVLEGYDNGNAISWTIDQIDLLDELVQTHDIIVSLLPYEHHVAVAKRCLFFKKNMVTTSYVSDEMTGVADDMVVEFNEDEDAELYDVMEAFADISNGEYRVEELTTCGTSCGSCSNTEYILFEVI